ncbi:hypothetical protein HW555_010432 [Spodoptera exigua]|uniref:Uncharacterized protein n=1 Tax=Spodoptera exigua TaxID=7107 RepID=A0A835L1J5_SPOEX|nr:hypothetical protein HW555_010432 [Spodoptera exigua]
MGKIFESFVWSVEVELSEDTEAKGSEEKSLQSAQQVIPEPETQSPAQAEEESAMKELLQVEEKYVPLITLLEKFSPGEDGIILNKKLRHFVDTISSVCPEERLVQEAFATIRAAALQSPVTARKLAAVGACFNSQPHLRRAMLNVVLQEIFTKLDILERSDPRYLVNAANIMGDYFAGARLSNGEKVHFLAEPLLQYMRALLASQDIRAHRSLATQLMQNGRELLSVLPQELDELSVSIRIRLLSPPPVCTTWLLLAADLCLNQFHPLPNNMQQFYAAHLELTSEESVSEDRNGCWRKSLEENVENIGQNTSQPRPELSAAAQLPGTNQTQRVRQNTFDSSTARIKVNKRLDLNSWRQPKGKQGRCLHPERRSYN